MRRLITSAALAATLAVPALAGGIAVEEGTVAAKRGADLLSVVFTVYKLQNRPVGVDNFEVNNLELQCDEGVLNIDFRLKKKGDDYFGVNDQKRFIARVVRAGKMLKVSGEFVTNNRVEGKIRAAGTFSGGTFTNCLGQDPYVARVING